MSILAYKDEVSTKVLNVEIFTMSPRPATNHNIVALNIFGIFKNFLKGKSCMDFAGGTDVYLTEIDRVLPDVMVICDRDIIKKNGMRGILNLIVEITSPNTVKNDKGYKKNLYEKRDVKEYWIVDTESGFIAVYLLDDSIFILYGVLC